MVQRVDEGASHSIARTAGDSRQRGGVGVVKCVWAHLAEDNVSLVAAGVGFYAMLAIFPTLAVAVSIYGLVLDPATLNQQIQSFSAVLPAGVMNILATQLEQLANASSGQLSIGLIVGVLLALWSSAAGMKSMMQALNIVYRREEARGVLSFNGWALLLTFGAIVFGLVALVLVIALPPVLGHVGLQSTGEFLASVLRWPLLLIGIMVALAVLFAYGPSNRKDRFAWFTWGGMAAAILWVAASVLFSFYVSNFGSYNKTYGSLAAVVILMMWFYISAYVVLLGAEINAALHERQHERPSR